MITDNYIKMCEKAEEIQNEYFISEDERLKNNWLWEYDIFACKEHRVIFRNYQTVVCPAIKGNLCNRRNNKIWLPTQEQLQEMILIDKKYKDMFSLNNDLNDFMIDDLDKKTRGNMNELWLAFVMYEIYNKIWTGEKWAVNE